MFGGADSNNAKARNDLWSYDRSTNAWSSQSTPLSGRFGANAAWDPLDNELLIFGGQTGIRLGRPVSERISGPIDRHLISGPGSLPGPPLPAPVARSHAILTWDSSAQRLLLFLR